MKELSAEQKTVDILDEEEREFADNEDSSRKEVIEYESPLKHIYETKFGNLSELETNLGKSTVRQLEAMGFITTAPSLYGDTWKISDRAKRLGDVSFKTYSLKERFKDFYRYKLPRMLFGA